MAVAGEPGFFAEHRPSGAMVLALLMGLLACGAQAEDAQLYFPPGACETGWLEVQIFDRAQGGFVPDPQHPRLRVGACARERMDRLLNEVRVRCIDPAGRRPPSAWVSGVDLHPQRPPPACLVGE